MLYDLIYAACADPSIVIAIFVACVSTLVLYQYLRGAKRAPFRSPQDLLSYIQPSHPYIESLKTHPAHAIIVPFSFVVEATANPIFWLSSRISVERLEAKFRAQCPSQPHPQQWHVFAIRIFPKQRNALLTRSGLCSALVQKLIYSTKDCRVMYPLFHAKRILSRFHFIGTWSKHAECLFHKGLQLRGKLRLYEAAQSWAMAAMLQHPPSHAFLADLMSGAYIRGSHVPTDPQKAFELVSAGAAMGCAHSKGLLGSCYIYGSCVDKDVMKGFALARESAASGSPFGQFVLRHCYGAGIGCTQDDSESARLEGLAAAQGHALAQFRLGRRFSQGRGVPQDHEEAMRLYRLAAAQGNKLAARYRAK